MKRKIILLGGLLAITFVSLRVSAYAQSKYDTVQENKEGNIKINEIFKQLEEKYDASLGIYAINPNTGEKIIYNASERFAYTSTYKAIAGGIILQKFQHSELDRRVFYKKEDLVTYSPITEKHVEEGMTVNELIHAAIAYSDNTAGNLLFNELNGPKGFEKELRERNDPVTQADRYETELNEATPGDIRDTTTPEAIGNVLASLMTGNGFEEQSYRYFVQTMKDNTTGDNLIRAGVPDNYTVGDKTGAGFYGTRNDIAFIQSENVKDQPLIWVIYSKKKTQNAKYDDKLIAEAAKVLTEYFGL